MNIFDPNSLLTTSQKQMLIDCSNISFQFKQFDCLDKILTDLGVDVIIEPGFKTRQIPSNLDAAINYWREETIRLEKLVHDEESEVSKQNYLSALENLRNLQNSIEKWKLMPLRGLYDPKSNVIRLYPEEMRAEYNGSRMDELLISTLAHETMHAFFNRPGHKSFPYIIFVEEPLAEFGMLLFLNETRVIDYNWAYNDVKNKKTCYSYGALLMDQYILEGQPSVTRQYLENYKIKLNKHTMPSITQNGGIFMPQKSTPIVINGNPIALNWQNIFNYPPCYFYDVKTKTLGLDGDWDVFPFRNRQLGMLFDVSLHSHIDDNNGIQSIYLGDHFSIKRAYHRSFLSEYSVVVSPANKDFYASSGIPLFRKNNKPVLDECGNGLYRISRGGKWGVIDAQLNLIVPIKYGFVWSYDQNGLIMVCNYDVSPYQYGLVNMQGTLQVPVIYEHITENNDGTYTVKQHGQEFVIDKNGSRI